MDRPQSEGKSSKFSSTTSINLLHILCLIILFLTLKQINLNAVNSTILEFFINFPLDFRHTAKSFTIILCLIAFSFYSFYELYWKRRFLPPGPVPWLVAGNMPQVLLHGASNIDLLLQKWNKYYGGIFTFWMGPIPVGVSLVLSSLLYSSKGTCSPQLTS
uniref:Uncharacterized protein n=2 Tax=Meloidogyne TaxID=189290 RepID=A0A6V7V0G8_MELEN|nr:unnamed protein product [Meloidogyne enterolobii]